MKRNLYIAISIIIIAIIIAIIYVLLRGSSLISTNTNGTTGNLPQTGTQSSTSGETQGIPAVNSGSSSTAGSSIEPNGQSLLKTFGIFANGPVLDYYVDAQNNITTVNSDGTIVEISGNQSSTLSSSIISGIISAAFSYDGRKILVSFGDPLNPQSSVFDITTKTWTALAQGMQSAQWSPYNYQIAYLTTTGSGKVTLSTIDMAAPKKSALALLTLNANDLSLQWPSKTVFILSDKPTYQVAGSIWEFNSASGSLTSLATEEDGITSVWSHTTTTIPGLVFSDNVSGFGATLAFENALTGVTQNLTFITLPSKCSFGMAATPSSTILTNTTSTTGTASSSATSTSVIASSSPYLAIYCGIPRDSDAFLSAHLPDDYNKLALFTNDSLFRVNTVTGQIDTIWNDVSQNVDATDLKFFGSTLFFVNRYDQKLYGATLNQ